MSPCSARPPLPPTRGGGPPSGRRRVALAALLLGPALLLPTLLPAESVRGGAAVDVVIESSLRALHQGEFGRALEGFEQAAKAAPGSPAPLFFVVFSRWWQLIFGETPVSKEDPIFDRGVESTMQAARARLEQNPDDAQALAALGGAQVLRSHLEAIRGNYLRSGQEARRGKKALDRAIRIDGSLDMALFPAGALNYFADRVPLVVKGLRPLFFFPGGDAALGLRQIREVAGGAGAFRTDGRLLLAQVCSDRYQRCYFEALHHFRIALGENPGSPLIAAAIGDLQIRLGEYRDAAATLSEALAGAGGDGEERSRQRQWLLIGLAEAQLGDWNVEEAERSLRRALQGPAQTSPSLRRTIRRLEEEMRRKADAAPLLPSIGAGGGGGSVPAAVDDAIRRDPEDPIPRFLRGRILLAAGRPEEALVSLKEAAAAADGEPPWLSGWIEILSGDGESRLGRLKEARVHYRRAGGIRHFRAADRARLALGEKGAHAAACSTGGSALLEEFSGG